MLCLCSIQVRFSEFFAVFQPEKACDFIYLIVLIE